MFKTLCIVLICAVFGFGAQLHFGLHKKETGLGDTLLVIGGIHGDEPGGYLAPWIFLERYKILSGNVWIVPNLNFDSIISNKRGIYGDMNRKFAKIDSKDKDYEIVSDIKKIITDPKVNLVLNLHDGHGFYRQIRKDGLFNPQAWGQACIIDQSVLANVKYGKLSDIAQKVTNGSSISLIEDVHEFNVKNTQTKDKDEAMRQSLTYFAISQKKPAFAVETSKNIADSATKALYQLRSLEQFMQIMGIKFSRDFELDLATVRKILADVGEIDIPPAKIRLRLSDIKEKLTYFPINSSKFEYSSKNPLVAAVKTPKGIDIYFGAKKLSTLQYQPFGFDDSLSAVQAVVDGKSMPLQLGSVVGVKDSFKILAAPEYRVNIIGYSKKGLENENNIELRKAQIDKNYAVDKASNSFRVEFYRGKLFCGTIIMEFANNSK